MGTGPRARCSPLLHSEQKEILNLVLAGFGDVEVFKREVRELEGRRTESRRATDCYRWSGISGRC